MPPAKKLLDVDRVAIVDEYGELKKKEKEFNPTKNRLDDLRKVILGWYEDSPASEEFLVSGRKYDVKISARELERKVDPGRLYKAVGLIRFLKLVSVTLETLKREGLQKLEILCVDQKQTGRRTLTPIPKAAVIPIRSAKTSVPSASSVKDEMKEAA